MDLDYSSIYVGAAALGGGLLILQVVLTLLGGDSDGGVDGEVDVDAAGGGLSFRTVVAFVAFFGVGGWMAVEAGFGGLASVAFALLAGSLAFWIAGLIMAQMSRLKSSGTVEIANALGAQARVYLTIPAERGGNGLVTVPIQGRTMEYKAITRGRELKTGALCKVVAVASSDTLEVESA